MDSFTVGLSITIGALMGIVIAFTIIGIATAGRLDRTTECIEAIQVCEADLPRSKICTCEIKTTVKDVKKD